MLDHLWRSPFTGDRNVIAQVPPKIVREILRTTIKFPAAEHIETFMIKQEQSARAFTFRVAQCTDVNGVGPAMDRMRTAVSSARRQLFGFDYFNDLRTAWLRLGINDMDT